MGDRAAPVSGLKEPLRVLDPACGDGNLLCAINDALPREMRRRVTLVGMADRNRLSLPLVNAWSRMAVGGK